MPAGKSYPENFDARVFVADVFALHKNAHGTTLQYSVHHYKHSVALCVTPYCSRVSIIQRVVHYTSF